MTLTVIICLKADTAGIKCVKIDLLSISENSHSPINGALVSAVCSRFRSVSDTSFYSACSYPVIIKILCIEFQTLKSIPKVILFGQADCIIENCWQKHEIATLMPDMITQRSYTFLSSLPPTYSSVLDVWLQSPVIVAPNEVGSNFVIKEGF